VRAIQRTHFNAKNAKNHLNPTDLVKRNFCFETEGVYVCKSEGVPEVDVRATDIFINLTNSWTQLMNK
jgi:hypothetical protein